MSRVAVSGLKVLAEQGPVGQGKREVFGDEARFKPFSVFVGAPSDDTDGLNGGHVGTGQLT